MSTVSTVSTSWMLGAAGTNVELAKLEFDIAEMSNDFTSLVDVEQTGHSVQNVPSHVVSKLISRNI